MFSLKIFMVLLGILAVGHGAHYRRGRQEHFTPSENSGEMENKASHSALSQREHLKPSEYLDEIEDTELETVDNGVVSKPSFGVIENYPTQASQGAESGFYHIKPFDLSDPSCKHVIARVLSVERKFLDMTSLNSKLVNFEEKYTKSTGDDYSSENSTSIRTPIVTELVNIAKDFVGLSVGVLSSAPPCANFIWQYVKFWIYNVFMVIIRDQIVNFFN